MSGSIMQFNPVAPIDVAKPLQEWANVGKTQAETGLIGQNVEAGKMGNELRRAQLGVQLPLINDLANGTQSGSAPGSGGAGMIGSAALTTGGAGTVIPGLGAVPKTMAMSIFSGDPKDWNASMMKMIQDKKALVGQMVGQTMDAQGKADPGAWNQMVTRAYSDGWMTNAEAQRFYNHPELATSVLSALAPAEQQPWFKGAGEAAVKGAGARFTPQKVTVPGPNGGTVEGVVPLSKALGLDGEQDADAPRGIRNNNPLNLEYTPNQGAAGSDGRFGVYPTMAHGVAANAQQLLSYQTDRGLNTVSSIINRWAPPGENNSGAYAAQVAKAMGVKPGAPIDLHNPQTMSRMIMAMGQVENGGRIIDPVAVQQGVAAALTPGSAQLPSAATPTAVVANGTPGPAGVTPTGIEEFTEPQKENIKQVTSYQDELNKQAEAAQQTNALIAQARGETANFVGGPTAPIWQKANKYLVDFANNVNKIVGSDVIPAPTEKVGSIEAFDKNMFQLASNAAKQLAARVTNFELSSVQKIFPSSETTPEGRENVFTQFLGLSDYMQAKNAAAAAIPKATVSPNKFESEWNGAISPMAFVIHRMSPSQAQLFVTNASKTPQGRKELGVWRDQIGFLESHHMFPAGQ